LDFRIELLDIQQLNDRLFAGDFDVAKTSFHAGLLLSEQTIVLPCGSALGFGVGPLLLAARPNVLPTDSQQVTLCPGQHTTAALLFSLFYPQTTSVQHVVFSEIMPMLQNGTADFGVCIHEGRFTWQEQGLSLIEDLGTRWENETDCPLPLGGLVASRDLPDDIKATVNAVIQDSLNHALQNRVLALPSMRRYAQEFDDDVLMQHVDLYVNDWTVDLGDTGRRALQELSRRAQSIGLTSTHARPVEVFTP
jgi:1,4-dihydroxy-6-naphthoate synthase